MGFERLDGLQTKASSLRPASRRGRAEGRHAQLLRLQRGAGNAAVLRALQRSAGTVTATGSVAAQGDAGAATQRECEEAIRGGDWEKLARMLSHGESAADDGLAFVAHRPWMMNVLLSLSPDQHRSLDDAARRIGRTDGRLRTAIKAAMQAKGVNRLQTEPGRGYGTLTVVQERPEDGDPDADPRKRYSYYFELSFEPGQAADADEIAFIQTARIVDSKTNDNLDFRSKRLTADHVEVDRLRGEEQGWYGMDDDETRSSNFVPWVRGGSQPAAMRDRPSGMLTESDWSFETSVVCRKGRDAGKVYAVVTWGFSVDDELKVTPKPHQIFNKPSKSFGPAVDAWNAQAVGPRRDRNAPGQKLLPQLR